MSVSILGQAILLRKHPRNSDNGSTHQALEVYLPLFARETPLSVALGGLLLEADGEGGHCSSSGLLATESRCLASDAIVTTAHNKVCQLCKPEARQSQIVH